MTNDNNADQPPTPPAPSAPSSTPAPGETFIPVGPPIPAAPATASAPAPAPPQPPPSSSPAPTPSSAATQPRILFDQSFRFNGKPAEGSRRPERITVQVRLFEIARGEGEDRTLEHVAHVNAGNLAHQGTISAYVEDNAIREDGDTAQLFRVELAGGRTLGGELSLCIADLLKRLAKSPGSVLR